MENDWIRDPDARALYPDAEISYEKLDDLTLNGLEKVLFIATTDDAIYKHMSVVRISKKGNRYLSIAKEPQGEPLHDDYIAFLESYEKTNIDSTKKTRKK